MSKPYTLTLSTENVETIAFVGGRYAWSSALLALEAGENALTEVEAWEIADAFDADSVGGHALFPMLAPDSDLYAKLLKFREAIV